MHPVFYVNRSELCVIVVRKHNKLVKCLFGIGALLIKILVTVIRGVFPKTFLVITLAILWVKLNLCSTLYWL